MNGHKNKRVKEFDMGEYKMEKVLSGSGDFCKIMCDFIAVQKKAEKERLRYVILVLNTVVISVTTVLQYDFFMGDDMYSIKCEDVVGVESIYDICCSRVIPKDVFLKEYIKLLPKAEILKIADKILLDFFLGEMEK